MRAGRLTLTQRQSVEYIAMSPRTHQIGDVARMAGVSVRTLRDYENVGLLSPSRFAHNIDRYAAGLTPFWSAAIRANAARLSADRPGAPRG
jgi:MerR family regulatory protein